MIQDLSVEELVEGVESGRIPSETYDSFTEYIKGMEC